MDEILVSVCIPTYNRLDYLPETLQSVFDQDFSADDYEVVIVDDGSTDGTKEWIAAQNLRVRYHCQENAGLAAARNKLIQLAKGKYIAFLDSDDLLTPGSLRSLVAAVAGREDLCSYGGYVRIDEQSNELATKPKHRPSGMIVQELFARPIVHSCGSLFPRKVLTETGGFNENLRNCPDYIKYLELSALYEFVGLPEPTFKRRRHTANMSQESSRTILAELDLLEDFYFNRGGQQAIDSDVAIARLAKEAYRVAKVAEREGHDNAFICEYYRKSLSYRFSVKVWAKLMLQRLR